MLLKSVGHVGCEFLEICVFTGVKVSQPCVSALQVAGALRRPQANTSPGILEDVTVILWILSLFNDFRVKQMLRSVGAARNKG